MNIATNWDYNGEALLRFRVFQATLILISEYEMFTQ